MNSYNSSLYETNATGAETATIVSSKARIPSFYELPDSAMVRIAQLVRGPKSQGQPVPLPISAASLWRKVANGSFPAPTKLGPRIACWRVSEVRAWLDSQVQFTKGDK